MRFALGYIALVLGLLVAGLVLDAIDVPAGGWLALAAMVGLIPVLWPVGLAEIPFAVACIVVLLPAAFLLEALGAPQWCLAALAGALFVGWLVFDATRGERPGGPIRIPAGYRFRLRKER